MKDSNHKYIQIKNASIHNLKNLDVDIPKNKITVITGPSGSGKSSLAFDTLFVEGQKRFIESLFSSSRHYLDKFSESSVEKITGLSPAISVDQKTKNLGPRSTVGTQTEIYDYLRVLFSKIATDGSNKFVLELNPKTISEFIHKKYKNDSIVIISKKTTFNKINLLVEKGYEKILFNDHVCHYKSLDCNNDQIVDVILSRFKVKDKKTTKQKIDQIINSNFDNLSLSNDIDKKLIQLQNNYKNNNGAKLTPQIFSFNSPYGFCSSCNGLGVEKSIKLDNLITSSDDPILSGGVVLFGKKDSILKKMTKVFIKNELELDPETVSINELDQKQKILLFQGSKKKVNFHFKYQNSIYDFDDYYPGLSNYILNVFKEDDSKDEYNLVQTITCKSCNGARLKPESLKYSINGFNINDLVQIEIGELIETIKSFKLTREEKVVSKPLISEIVKRLDFLISIGLQYLPLSRLANTLSGGESQRIKIATQLGSSLSGITYVLDEPSIGLHPKDNSKLIKTLKILKKLNNTLVVVEHDKDMILSADYVIDIGPGAGEYGGNIIAKGSPNILKKDARSITGEFLKNKKRKYSNEINFKNFISVKKINYRNLKDIDVKFPTNSITSIVGVSGSGKSTLTHDVIGNAIRSKISTKNLRHLYKKDNYKSISGHEDIKQVINLDQKPIGRSSKSNPATYLGIFSLIRDLFASTPEAKLKGFGTKHFSFNLKDGRCDECDGSGEIKIEMQFMQDVRMICKKCNGKKYSNKILNIKYKNHDISQILNLTVEKAQKVFCNHRKINEILQILIKIGLGYIKLGQSSRTISGGEAQRLKIAKELSKQVKGHTLYILDEPSTGLHFSDINLLINCIYELKKGGHTVIIIEHNADIISISDYIVEVGPHGGREGGNLLFQGQIKRIFSSSSSITKDYL